jgi:hypothetical protein
LNPLPNLNGWRVLGLARPGRDFSRLTPRALVHEIRLCYAAGEDWSRAAAAARLEDMMTTNAIDQRKRIVASDSRWSFERDGHLYFVDDTGFDKIVDRPRAAIICAGDAQLIADWKAWFTSRIPSQVLPATERTDRSGAMAAICVSVIAKPTCQLMFRNGWYLSADEDAMFTGTGAQFAYQCYLLNKCGRLSIASAAKSDPQTGGETKYIELDTNKHNVSLLQKEMKDLDREMLTRGMVMNMTTKKVVTIHEHQAAHGSSAQAAIARFDLSAPTGHAPRAWSDAEKEKLSRVMAEITQLEEEDSKQSSCTSLEA